jgi:uracil-DNA glycosylase family 4
MPRPDRRRLLAEMGLAPLWRLRRADSVAMPLAPHPEPHAEHSLPESSGAAARLAPMVPTEGAAREASIGAMDWVALKQAVPACTACGLHAGRKQAVFGVGDERADWLLVGEAPGAEEDRLGEPFVGQAGRLLDAMLDALALKRGQNVYIANVLKCRPPGNRNPEAGEVAQCTPFLLRQIALIEPRLIVAMGRFAAQTLLATDATIASLRGRVHRYAGVPLIVTYHPAYLLRNLPDKAKAWADLVFARRTLADLRARS